MDIKQNQLDEDFKFMQFDCTNLRIFEFIPKCIRVGSVSSNDSGLCSYAHHDTSSSSSVYTAADCRLLQQISNTAATRNLNSQCSTRALSPHTLHPATTQNATTMNVPQLLPQTQSQQQQLPPPPTLTPPPYLMRGQNLQMFIQNGGNNGVTGGSHPLPQHLHNNRPLSPPLQQPNMPPPYATAAAMLHHNHRHSNMHGKF